MMENNTLLNITVPVNANKDTFASYGEVIMFIILVPVTCIFGISVNVLTVYLIRYQGYWNATNITFLVLSVSDLGGLVTALIYSVFRMIKIFDIERSQALVICYILPFFVLQLTFNSISCLLNLFLALQRPLTIYRTLKCKKQLTNKMAMYIGGMIFLIASVCNMIGIFTREKQIVKDNTTQIIQLRVLGSGNSNLIYVYKVVYIAGFFVLPVFFTGVMNLLTVIFLLKIRTCVVVLNGRDKYKIVRRELKKSICFLCITTVFILFTIWKPYIM